MVNVSKIIVALDHDSVEAAQDLVDQLHPEQCQLKVGSILFTKAGPTFVEALVAKGFNVFLDLKFHDIPHTVFHAIKAAAELGVWMLTVHTAGGQAMLQAAMEAVSSFVNPPKIVGVSVLTSLELRDVKATGCSVESIAELVLMRAALAKRSGLDGLVCSGQEVSLLRTHVADSFHLVTPGIRLEKSDDDQKRAFTPLQAVSAGSDFLVIGRPITQSAAPAKTLDDIYQSIRAG